MKRKPVPMTCTEKQLLTMSHDNVCVGDFSISTDTLAVYLSDHVPGQPAKQNFEIPRKVFNKLIRWYTEGTVPREDAKSRRPR